MPTKPCPIAACTLGALLAAATFAITVGPQPLTFMADDYAHLRASYANAHLFADHFATWLSRVPVWAAATYALFASHVLEQSWWPMVLFFAVHAAATAGMSAFCARLLPAVQVPASVWALSTAVLCFYPNTYEIVYWPTCMPYALGGLLLALGLLCRPSAGRVVLLAASMLTYETFILPALVGLLLEPGRRRRALGVWTVAVALTLGLRAWAARSVGSFHHGVNFAPAHVVHNLLDCLPMLLRFKHYRMHTALLPTALFAALLLLGPWLRRPKIAPRQAATLLGACLASTALFWFLGYGAMRSVYGTQLLLCGIAINLLAGVYTLPRLRMAATGALLVGLAIGFWRHQDELWQIKRFNQEQLSQRQADLVAQMQQCTAPCVLAVADPQAGLQPDWLLPRDFWAYYYGYLRLKYAPHKDIAFEVQDPTPLQSAASPGRPAT